MVKIENKRKKSIRILIFMNLSLLLAALIYDLFFVLRGGENAESFCFFKNYFSLYCPGCGGSRVLHALLRLKILKSIKLYPPLIISLIPILAYDVRLSLFLIKRDEKYIKNFRFLSFLIIPAAVILFFFFRNILLLCFGIDPIGDIIAPYV